MQNLSETMALASSHGEAEASLPSFARTPIKYEVNILYEGKI
ncbi:MAG: hypothetical protein U9O24_09865 [Campylobacterota bacterium]|nr:hypothetical protein [Campylobacterota bacterium]